MRLIYEPSVYLIGMPQVDHVGLRAFLDAEGVPGWETDTTVAAQVLPEVAGRLCYMSFAKPRPGGNAAYLGHILEVAHGSVLEHATFTLVLTGISRACSHELVRHRHLSPSQLSQRYVDEGDCAFVVPPALADAVREYRECFSDDRTRDPEPVDGGRPWIAAGAAWCDGMWHSLARYARLVEYLAGTVDGADATARRKAAREAARSVLPNATETRMCITGNARALRGFLDQRARPEADAEIRRLAVAVHAKLAAAAPNLFGDYTPDPAGGLTTPHRKV